MDWRLQLDGRRKRRLYPDDAKADVEIEAYRKEVKKQGAWWVNLPALHRQTIATVCMQIEAAGLNIQSVSEDYKNWKMDRSKQETLTPKPLEGAIEEFRTRKIEGNKTERYVNEICKIFTDFAKGQEKRNIHEVLPEEVETFVDGRWTDPGSRRTQFGDSQACGPLPSKRGGALSTSLIAWNRWSYPEKRSGSTTTACSKTSLPRPSIIHLPKR